ncbi:MAG: DUF4169 family protein [Hyphomicrobiaceae bacterium]
MTGEIINLKRARKAKARSANEAVAEANRVRFGRTKVERELSSAKDDLAARRLDGHRLTREGDDGPESKS